MPWSADVWPAVPLASGHRLSLSIAEACACRPLSFEAYWAREAAADDSPQAAEPVAAQVVSTQAAGEPTRFVAEARARSAAAVDDSSPDVADSARVDSALQKADDRCVPAARMDGSPDDCSAPVDSAEGDKPDSADSAQAGLAVAGSAADDYSELADPVAPRPDGSLRAGSMNSFLACKSAPAGSPAEAVQRADSFQADCPRPADCLGDFPQPEVAPVSPAEP